MVAPNASEATHSASAAVERYLHRSQSIVRFLSPWAIPLVLDLMPAGRLSTAKVTWRQGLLA
jgi:hypothetical protein